MKSVKKTNSLSITLRRPEHVSNSNYVLRPGNHDEKYSENFTASLQSNVSYERRFNRKLITNWCLRGNLTYNISLRGLHYIAILPQMKSLQRFLML